MSGKTHESLSDAALEHIMRDVLSGLEDFSNKVELECQAVDMEIVYIKPAQPEETQPLSCRPAPPAKGHTRKSPRLRLLQ